MDVRALNAQFWLQNEKDCLDLVKKEWQQIPLLNANDIHNLQDHKLVRFRGMVQDMYDPEYYFEKYEVVNEVTTETYLKDGKFRDTADCGDREAINFESKKNVTNERHTFVLISIPGLNDWAQQVENTKYKIPAPKQDAATSPLKAKRSHEDDNKEVTSPQTSQEPSTSSKKQCTTSASTAPNLAISQEHLLNFPLPSRAGKACHLKVYNGSDAIKLNELIECVGFLSVDPLLSQSGAADEDSLDSVMEVQTHNPPPSLVPRIHCVTFKKVEGSNPLCDEKTEMSSESMVFVRKELHIVLTQLLLGDELAAEYLIYHLLSRVYLRKELMAIGKFSMNISNIPSLEIPEYGEEIYKFIELLLPKSHYLPMTLDNMNDLAFIPKKDYECNRITSGILQLGENTHLVLDETKLSPGKLNEAAVKAVGAISNCIKHQKITYDFSYYQMEFDCDIPILVLSEGKSLLPSDCHVPLKLDEVCVNTFGEIAKAAKVFLKPELLDAIRTYLSLRKHASYELSDNVQELVQAEFVKMRQNSRASADDLHNLLVLARLICLSEGNAVLDEACWRRACQLETERKERIPK